MAEKQELSPELKEKLKAEFNRDWRKELRKAIPVKERMKISRLKMPEREPEQRNKDFNEVNLGLDEKMAQIEAQRCLDCANPQCILGCPVRIDIPSFIKLIEKGDFIASARKLKETNSLPAICGRVCPQESQCELTCTVKKATGVSVAIGNLERFASDFERFKGAASLPRIPPSTGNKVAIIGAGPAGLTVAGELVKRGHQVTVFEALHVAGGVLVYGIPEFRLPKGSLQAEVEYLEKLGVELRTNFVVGLTATLEDLKNDGYDAFFIGSGAGLPNFMRIPGENLIGVYSANEYLTRVNLMKAYEFPEYDTPVFLGKRAAVIGGGNVAMDSVRTAKRLGAELAAIVYRRSRVEMPARVEEVKHGEEEGVEFHFLTTPIRYFGDENGRVKAMECLRMELGEPDESGRRRPVPIEGSEFIMEVNLVVVAIGQSPNPLIPQTTPGLEVGKWGNVEVDWNTMATSIEGVYAGGDIIRGGATVILAMGDGRIAAEGIDKYLKRKKSQKRTQKVKKNK
jgi:glutamate synthase (NADPH/NADH) small chain